MILARLSAVRDSGVALAWNVISLARFFSLSTILPPYEARTGCSPSRRALSSFVRWHWESWALMVSLKSCYWLGCVAMRNCTQYGIFQNDFVSAMFILLFQDFDIGANA